MTSRVIHEFFRPSDRESSYSGNFVKPSAE